MTTEQFEYANIVALEFLQTLDHSVLNIHNIKFYLKGYLQHFLLEAKTYNFDPAVVKYFIKILKSHCKKLIFEVLCKTVKAIIDISLSLTN